MYMYPTEIGSGNGSPERPSNSLALPVGEHHALAVAVRDGVVQQARELVLARTVEDRGGDVGAGGDLVGTDRLEALRPLVREAGDVQPRLASQPRWISRTCPGFIRDGTPSGLRMMSTGVPSSRNGMSSIGRIFEMTPLLP